MEKPHEVNEETEEILDLLGRIAHKQDVESAKSDSMMVSITQVTNILLVMSQRVAALEKSVKPNGCIPAWIARLARKIKIYSALRTA